MSTPPAMHRPAETPVRGSRRWLWGGGALVVVAFLTAAGLGWQRQQARRAAEAALRLARQGRFAEAEPALRDALAHDPDNVEWLQALALGLLGAERLADAEPLLTRWCELRPADAEPFRLRMYERHRAAHQTKLETDFWRFQEQALADGWRVLELDPADDSAAQEVVWLCLALGRADDAEPVCHRCRQRQPADPWLMYLQARVYQARGANAEAAALLDALLAVQPQFARGLLLRAILYHEANADAKAVPLLRQVLALDRVRQAEARYYLGLALARTGHADEAQRLLAEVQLSHLNRAASRSGHADLPAVQVRRAELLFNTGRADEALSVLGAVLREDPGYAPAHRLLASYHARRGEEPKAAEHRRRAEGGAEAK